jgi:hypothetical protein
MQLDIIAGERFAEGSADITTEPRFVQSGRLWQIAVGL